MIEYFLQSSQMLAETQHELQGSVLGILSKLALLKFYDFGKRCFEVLEDLMNSSKEMESKILRVIKREVINKMDNAYSPLDVPLSLI